MNNDVLLEILLHLPVQSLFRVRAVCKLWCYIIDSPHFILPKFSSRYGRHCNMQSGLGFDEDYKVVQLLQCSKHCSLHANMLNIERSDDIPIWGNDDCVVLRGRKRGEVILYDYRARKFIRRFKMGCISASDEDIIEYVGSLLSPLKQF
ncbi:hypothetical protein SASPL_145950 [Salvia splendens]|uniref:F-box domain-containing protein n=1 Tax=Salvia splendens TaxID=180675 RepID=A0A8X8Z7T7_SALSN|nr:hypothetical protein SASPL_145950 [Salvia splendens]